MSHSTRDEKAKERKGEKIGWIGGWFGSFIWLFILSVIWFVQGLYLTGLVGFILFLFAAIIIVYSAPWRHPDTRYWKLFLWIYPVFVLSVGFAIWAAGGPSKLGLNPWNLLLVLLLLIPIATAGKRTWNDQGNGADPSLQA